LSVLSITTILLVSFYFFKPDTSLIEINNQDLSQLLYNEESFIVYVGRPTCPACSEIEPVLRSLLRNLGTSIYYFNTDDARAEDSERMDELLAFLGVRLVPSIFYIEYGNVKDSILLIHDEQDLEEFLKRNIHQ